MILDLSILAAKQDMNCAITTYKVLVGENEKFGYSHYFHISEWCY